MFVCSEGSDNVYYCFLFLLLFLFNRGRYPGICVILDLPYICFILIEEFIGIVKQLFIFGIILAIKTLISFISCTLFFFHFFYFFIIHIIEY